jgi:hypothetical protein
VPVDLALRPSLERLTTSEPISAWRAWTLTGRTDGSHLRLRPVAGRRHPWPPGARAEATCNHGHLHQAPHLECSCGLHGTHGVEILRRTKSPAVLGTVSLWGRVVEHDHGYRAQYAYPQHLRLVCLLCFAQWALHGSRPDVVVAVGWGHLIPFCPAHYQTAMRYGLRQRRGLPAQEVQQRLLETYSVDPLGV